MRAIELLAYWEGRVVTNRLSGLFGVSRQQASQDIKRYNTHNPNVLIYRPSAKGYVPVEHFCLAFTSGQISEYLDLITGVAGEPATVSFVSNDHIAAVQLPDRSIDPMIFRDVIRACRASSSLEIGYSSMNNPSSSRRTISPHTLVYTGFRWHVRAFCYTNRDYRDFILSRISESEPRIASDTLDLPPDQTWLENITFQLIPNPKLSNAQQKLVERDYGMEQGFLEFSTRKALAHYTIQRFQSAITEKEATDPLHHPLVLRESDRARIYPFLLIKGVRPLFLENMVTMAFQVSSNYNMIDNIHRLLTAQCQRALKHLSQHDADPINSIHEARVSLKRARSLSLLLREQLGEKQFNDLTGRIRDLAQGLSSQRDPIIRTQIVREFLEFDSFNLPTDTKSDSSAQLTVASARAGLSKLLAQLPAPVAGKRAKGFSAIRKTSLEMIRQEQRARLRAAKTGRDKHYHHWRKRAKHVYHLISIMRPLRPRKLALRRQEFYQLTQLLGRIQDLVITAEDLDKLGLNAGESEQLGTRLLEARSQAMQQAIYLGNEITIDHPVDFIDGLEKHWKRLREGK